MSAARWLKGAQDELQQLAPIADRSPADAWRAATLIVRLVNGPAEFTPPPEFVRRLPELITLAGPPDPQRILDDVADGLDSVDDPWGPLADALLDADDAVSVMAWPDKTSTAIELADRVAALVSLWPERVIDLGDFAQMRLESMRDGVAPSCIWRAVAAAPALVLIDALAPQSAAEAPTLAQATATAIAPVLPIRLFELPTLLHLAAADSDEGESFQLTIEGRAGSAWIYAEEGDMRLELAKVSVGITAELVIRVGGEARGEHALSLEVDGATAYANLGKWAGQGNLLHRLAAEEGAAPQLVSFVLRVSDG